MTPLVSILIPAYNAEEWIADSITSGIRQTWPRKEIIVVDDGSNDQTLRVARQFACEKVSVVTQQKQGAAASRNRAFELCQGDYIQWLDADDLLSPNKVARQVTAAQECQDKRRLLSSGWGYFMYRPDKAKFVPTALWSDLTPVEWLLRKWEQNLHMQTATWLVSRELTEAAGPWDTRLLGDDDGEYFCRVLLASSGVRFVPDAKVYYRLTAISSRLSYIGQSERKLEAHFLSRQLQIGHLRSLQDDERFRTASLKYLQRSFFNFYPERVALVRQMQQLAAMLDGELEIPRLPGKYRWIQKLFGRAVAKRVRQSWNLWKSSAMRSWDKALFRLEGANTARKNRAFQAHSGVRVLQAGRCNDRAIKFARDYAAKLSPHKFLIIGGTSRSGTTSVFNYLAGHPQICPSDKETRYFLDADYPLSSKGRYQKNGPEAYLSLFNSGPSENWRLEATPDYLYSANTPLVIKQTLPNVRFIFILREPASRLLSWYRFARKRGEIPFNMTFDDYVAIQRKNADVILAHRRHPAFCALEHGRYSLYLRHYFELFGDQSIHVLFYEKLQRDPLAFVKLICRLVSIDETPFEKHRFDVLNKGSDVRNPYVHRAYVKGKEQIRSLIRYTPGFRLLRRQIRRRIDSAYERLNVTNGGRLAMSPSTRDFLLSYYADEPARLKELLGIEVPWLSNPPSALTRIEINSSEHRAD